MYESHVFLLRCIVFPTAVEVHGFRGFADRNLMTFVSESPNLRNACFLRVGGPVFGDFDAPHGKSTERGKVQIIGVIIRRKHAFPGGGGFPSAFKKSARD